MNRIIPVGTCIPGGRFTQWVPALMGKGFECFSINFHMEFHGIELEKFSDKVRAIMEGGQEYVASLGYYCNALQFEEHRKSLEKCIDLAHTFGTNLVTTFAGGLEGRSVEESMPKFKEVFGELCKRAEDKGVKICIENCPMDGTWKHVTCNIGFNPRAWEMMFNEVSRPGVGACPSDGPAHRPHRQFAQIRAQGIPYARQGRQRQARPHRQRRHYRRPGAGGYALPRIGRGGLERGLYHPVSERL